MAKSAVTIGFTAGKKTVSVSGDMAIRETVEVTVTNGAALIADGLKLRIIGRTSAGANVEIAECVTWETSGLNAVGDLDLNTVEAIAQFAGRGNAAWQNFNLNLYADTVPIVKANGSVKVMNFPAGDGSSPTARSEYP